MDKKVQKGALILIIILLIIFVPLACLGLYFRFSGPVESPVKENVGKEFFFDNKLWFYKEDGSLLGTYECTTKNCNYALNTVDDSNYGLDSFESNEDERIKIIDNRYAILNDNETSEEAFVYDIVNNTSYKMAAYVSAKDYGVGLADNMLIVKNSAQKYGVIKLADTIEIVLPFEYDFIGLKNEVNSEGKLATDYFITLKNGNWNLTDKNGATLTVDIADTIIDYTGTYIITKNNQEIYHLINYNNEAILTDDFANLSFIDKYLSCTTVDNTFYLYDLANKKIASETYDITANDEILTDVDTNNNVVISINDQVVETIS